MNELASVLSLYRRYYRRYYRRRCHVGREKIIASLLFARWTPILKDATNEPICRSVRLMETSIRHGKRSFLAYWLDFSDRAPRRADLNGNPRNRSEWHTEYTEREKIRVSGVLTKQKLSARDTEVRIHSPFRTHPQKDILRWTDWRLSLARREFRKFVFQFSRV